MHRCGGDVQSQLKSDCCEEPGHFATVAVASLEEEAGAKAAEVCEGAGYGARNGGFSGAGHAVEPEDGLCSMVGPFVHLVQEIDSCVGVTGGGSSLGEGVEGGTVGAREPVE